MTILVTGSSGHLGRALVLMLRDSNQDARGLDKNPNPPTTDMVGSITDKDICRAAVKGCSYVLHTASLHKPHVATHTRQDFVDVNVTGTLNLLEAVVEENKAGGNVRCFVLTSTTSTFGGALSGWIDEDVKPIPKNIYGVSKCMAEDLCQLFTKLHKLPTIVLKVSRFFPEDDDKAEVRNFGLQSNVKLNELLIRRADIYDMCTAHIAAMEKGPDLGGHERFIISSDTCFTRDDVKHLMTKDQPHTLLSKYFSHADYEETYKKAAYKMFPVVDRVYCNEKAKQLLGWKPIYTFEYGLNSLRLGRDLGSELANRVGSLGYHDQTFDDINGPFPVNE